MVEFKRPPILPKSLVEHTMNMIADICRIHNIADLYAFGSRSREILARVQGLSTEPGPAASDVDIGRHILAKGFAVAASEYKEIGPKLAEQGVLSPEDGVLMRRIAGYRNRMVHFYSEVSTKELYILCTRHNEDMENICDGIAKWLREHPDKMDKQI